MVDMDGVKRDVAALDNNGKLLLFGSAVGVIGCFLEWYGSNFSTSGPISFDMSVSGVDQWRGRVALLGLAAALGSFCHQTWGSVDDVKGALYLKIQLGGTGLAALLALWFWLVVDTADMGQVTVGTSFGLWITFLGSAAATFGAFQRFQAARVGAGGPDSGPADSDSAD